MTVKDLAKALDLEVLCPGGQQRVVTGGYTGDLLSWVMARLPEDAAWLTVMGNLNAVSVAVLKDAACMILTDGASLDEKARERALAEDIPVLRSAQGSFSLGARLASLL